MRVGGGRDFEKESVTREQETHEIEILDETATGMELETQMAAASSTETIEPFVTDKIPFETADTTIATDQGKGTSETVREFKVEGITKKMVTQTQILPRSRR